MKPTSFLLLALLGAVLPLHAADALRERRNFDEGWKFHLGDAPGSEKSTVDDRAWRSLNLPHDWSIEGTYSASNAAGTAYLPGGIGWYRKSFTLPETARERRVFIEFDGVYRDSDVWINGHLLGHRPYGYSSFEYELTPYLTFGGAANLLAVRVDHSVAADSRFYTGSGIYRHVWLTTTGQTHIEQWGAYVHIPIITEAQALVSIETNLTNQSAIDVTPQVTTTIVDPAGQTVGTVTTSAAKMGTGVKLVQQVAVSKPQLWSLETPVLYTAVTRVLVGGSAVDEVRTPFGIRSIRFDANHGFFLNGKPLKMKGVCLHHDLGALGAAFNEAALARRLKILKDLGVNAIRCSHNPMAPEEYDLLDRMGFLVMDEAFDEWIAGKHKWIVGWNAGTPGTRGYHEAFAEWSDRDLADMVRRDRNHPSIVMWSIGNEIEYPGDPFAHPMGANGMKPGNRDANELVPVARNLIAVVKMLDDTRPVTQALADSLSSNATGLANLLDVDGYNYLEQHYAKDHQTYPERVILGSENSHALSAWRAVAANEYVVGQFLWTGVDYLGESVRYPDRGNAAGLLDLCGFRKPMSYFREALWSDRPMVYAAAREAAPAGGGANRAAPLAEHWNWAGDSRKAIPVEVYTNCDAAEVFLNGKSLGEKPRTDAVDPVLHWDVPNEAGTLRVIGKKGGKESARFELATAGKAHHIQLSADRTRVAPGGEDLTHVTIQVVDADGRRVYGADATVEVQVTGAGELVAVDTGDLRDTTAVQAGHRKVFQGRALALVRGAKSPGAITVRVSAPGLEPASLPVEVK